jgi:hypothetical protein
MLYAFVVMLAIYDFNGLDVLEWGSFSLSWLQSPWRTRKDRAVRTFQRNPAVDAAATTYGRALAATRTAAFLRPEAKYAAINSR